MRERNAFFDIMDEIDNMYRTGNLIIQGYPMLTQFTAGVIFMLGHLFEKVIKPIINKKNIKLKS